IRSRDRPRDLHDQRDKKRSTFLADEAIFKIVYLAIRNASGKWTMPIKNRDWRLTRRAAEARKRTGSVLTIRCQLHKKI
ncbi:MAG: hypothetical protein LBG22_09975, partial [Treponema sp.]|nr:hypothetical protein [Treponema sp.]